MDRQHRALSKPLGRVVYVAEALLLVLAGCSHNSSGRSSPAPVATSESASPIPEPEPSEPGPAINFGTAAHWSFGLEDQNGDRTDGTLTVGRFSAPAEAQALPGGQTATGSPCTVDAERDVVAPAVLTISNANETLSQKLDVSFFAFDDRHPQADGAVIDAAAFYGNAPQCIGITPFTFSASQAALGLGSTDALAPGRSVSVSLYLVLHNFVTPELSGGDEAMLRHVALVLYLGGKTGGAPRRLVQLQGPKGGTVQHWPRLPLVDLAPQGLTVAELIHRDTKMGCGRAYQLRATAGRDILIETVSVGGTGAFKVVGSDGALLLRFRSSLDEPASYTFGMPPSGRATITDDGSTFSCVVDMGIWYAP